MISPNGIIAIVVLAGLVAVGVAAERAVSAYNEALESAENSKEIVRLRDIEIDQKKRLIADEKKARILAEKLAKERSRREEDAKSQLEERDRRIEELRRKNATVDAFMAQPVPPELREPSGDAKLPGPSMRHSDGGSSAKDAPSEPRRDSR